jgi:hypothetical protein
MIKPNLTKASGPAIDQQKAVVYRSNVKQSEPGALIFTQAYDKVMPPA